MTRAHATLLRATIAVATISLSFMVFSQPAAAQSDGFKSTLEAYLMGASMAGTVGAGPVSTAIDVPSSTIFENLKFAALVDYRGEAPKWAVAADVVYMNLGKAGTSDGGRVAVDVGAEQYIVDLVGAYRISKSFEVIGGVRYTGLNTTISQYGPLGTREAKLNEGWLDPVVGVQAFLPLSEAFQLQVRGDIGGFGVGCDFTWQAAVRVNWQVSRAIRLGLGYRWLDQDYETGSGSDYFKWNVLTQGPLLAAGVTF
jgi:hypothetical protein